MSSDSENRDPAKMTKAELVQAIGAQFRVNQNRSDVFDEIAADHLGLNRTDQRCLDVISRLGRVTAGELAEEAGLTTGGVTAVVDRLEKAGYARRVPDERDRRKVLIEITPHFHERTWPIWGPLAEEWQRQSASLTHDQLEFLLRFLTEGNEISARHIERLREMRDSK
jgi:DNA-binding MarR family transcriptional regulator